MMHRFLDLDNSETEISIVPEAAAPLFIREVRFFPGAAVREVWREGYGLAAFRRDVLAGLVVGLVALPLAMALAIASGVPPQHGLYTAIVSGAVIALLGGSRTQVSGPTAAFVVILAPISAQFGVGGLVLASLLAGGILVALGLARLGKFIEYVPYPVITGFTSGIAVVIAVLQLKDFLGLTVTHLPDHFPERVAALLLALPSTRWQDLVLGCLTLVLLLVWPRLERRIPAPLAALTVAGLTAVAVGHFWPDFRVATVGNRFSTVIDGVSVSGIPRSLPRPTLPWNWPGGGGAPLHLSLNLFRQLLPSAFAIAILGAIESLLSAVVADGMARTRHDPDAELVGQGIGNLIGPFFGAFAATGAIARTATNIRSGGRTPLAALVHSLVILGVVLVLAPLIGFLPLASLAALLLLVAWNMSEFRHFVRMLKIAPRNDVLVLLTCFFLTVLFDMVIGVSVGLVLASLLFIHTMAVTSIGRVVPDRHPALLETLPPQTVLYEISGPLFFGAAQKAMSALEAIADSARTVILSLGAVQVIDATGLVNLESVLSTLSNQGVYVILTGIRPQPAKALARAGIRREPGRLALCRSWKTAVRLAFEHHTLTCTNQQESQ